MKFTKLFAAGRDYIFLSDDNAFDAIKEIDIIRVCDRKKGVGADGVIAIRQNDAETSRITGFCRNGESMQDFSSASICAAFVLFLEKSIGAHTFLSPNGGFFTVSEGVQGKNVSVICDMGRGEFNLKYPAVQRKTQLGNRILTLTALELHGIHTVHFSGCKDALNISYLGEQVSRCSLFQKRAALTLAQKCGDNCFDINYYENKTGYSSPPVSAFSATALAACKEETAEYSKEIKITCGNSEVFAVCKENGEVSVQCIPEKAFCGKL